MMITTLILTFGTGVIATVPDTGTIASSPAHRLVTITAPGATGTEIMVPGIIGTGIILIGTVLILRDTATDICLPPREVEIDGTRLPPREVEIDGTHPN